MTVIGVLRLIDFCRAFNDPTHDFMNTWGPAYSQIESDLAIITACAPALRPLLGRWFPSLFQSEHSLGGAADYRGSNTFGGGAKASRSRTGRGGRGPAADAFQLRDMGSTRTEIRGHSPDGSDEEIMTPSGIMKKTQVRSGVESWWRSAFLPLRIWLTPVRLTFPTTQKLYQAGENPQITCTASEWTSYEYVQANRRALWGLPTTAGMLSNVSQTKL